MRNRHFNRHYEAALATIGTPIFPSDRDGLGRLLKHLRSGGMVGLLVDIYVKGGAELSFFGQTAPTALSAAQLALRHDAPLVPIYGIRQSDGIGFHILAEAPVPHTDAATMTQALNDSLERQVRGAHGPVVLDPPPLEARASARTRGRQDRPEALAPERARRPARPPPARA